MTFYLIDFENVKSISSLKELTEEDTILFFYTQNVSSVSFALFKESHETRATVRCIRTECGKNALDFQLSSYVGYLIAQHPKERFVIISQDKGFENVAAFWKREGVCLEIRNDVGCATSFDEKDRLAKTLQDTQGTVKLSAEDIDKVVQIVLQYRSKQAINNNLMKHFRDSEKVGKITKVIKPFLKNKS